MAIASACSAGSSAKTTAVQVTVDMDLLRSARPDRTGEPGHTLVVAYRPSQAAPLVPLPRGLVRYCGEGALALELGRTPHEHAVVLVG